MSFPQIPTCFDTGLTLEAIPVYDLPEELKDLEVFSCGARNFGQRWPCRAVHMCLLDGTSPSLAWFNNAITRPETKQAAARLFNRIRMTCQSGPLNDKKKFRAEFDDFSAFKAQGGNIGFRVPCVQIGSTWCLTHVFEKRQTAWPDREIAEAKRIREEFEKVVSKRQWRL